VAGSSPRAVIFGLSGPSLQAAEREFFAQCDPLGFILFARNCVDPAQVRTLVGELRACVGRPGAMVLIDQEGGRVQRLKPPHWRAAPPAEVFGRLCERDEAGAVEAAWLNGRLLAADLAPLGIDVDCAPVLDVRQPDGHAIIGDRAFAARPERVALLARATCSGLLAGGVLPVIKHIPGHGRATLDSHEALPVVDAPRDVLEHVDFPAFAALADMPIAMTAHVVYAAIDPDAPATTSATVVRRVIRGAIGFDGLLLSDDLCMRALAGRPAERATAALAAGCDVLLHCNGVLADMDEVAGACTPLSYAACLRLARAEEMRTPPQPFDAAVAAQRLAELLGTGVSA